MDKLYVVFGVNGNVISICDNKENAERRLKECNRVAKMYFKDGYSCSMKTFVVDKESKFPTEWKEQENMSFIG